MPLFPDSPEYQDFLATCVPQYLRTTLSCSAFEQLNDNIITYSGIGLYFTIIFLLIFGVQSVLQRKLAIKWLAGILLSSWIMILANALFSIWSAVFSLLIIILASFVLVKKERSSIYVIIGMSLVLVGVLIASVINISAGNQ
jgi:hypothetical protein